MNNKIKIGIYGGSGYGGSELLRILLFHPNAEIVFVTANEQAGKSVADVHRNLAGLTDQKFSQASEITDLGRTRLRISRTTPRPGHGSGTFPAR
jgi:N-acetyl-gamma-glutamylphosphate reductase